MPPTADASDASEVYQTIVEAALASEEDRTKTVEGRGAAIIRTSTTMLTLIFGLSIIVSGKDYTFKSHYAILFLAIALVAFVIAAVIALIVQVYGPRYRVISTATLESLVENINWNRTADDARRMWINREIETIRTVRHNNDAKATLVHTSLGLEIAAITLLTTSLAFEFYTRF